MKCDDSLIKRAMAGDKGAFVSLYKQMYEDMYKFSYLMLGNREDAIDAVSDAVLDIYKNINKVRNVSAFYNWCMKILWAKCKQKRKEYFNKSVEYLEELEATSDFVKENSLENIYLKEELIKLDYDERTIILLKFLYGYNSREIAEIMKLKPTTVRSKQSRALEKLRERMVNYEC